MYTSMEEIVQAANAQKLPLHELMVQQEISERGMTREEIYEKMDGQLTVMEKSIERGLSGIRSHSGLTGMDAPKLYARATQGQSLVGQAFTQALSYSMAVTEVNAGMGIICATPTAGSSGILPAILMTFRDKLELTRTQQVDFLLTAGLLGMIIGNRAGISGAQAGCQAEVGAASGMAAGALTEAAGGTPEQIVDSVAISLANILGLVCDPVAGLVEIPCIKRNSMGVANALAAVEIVLAGIPSKIPCDEVIVAMGKIGAALPIALRETALGGLAQSKTALRLKQQMGNPDLLPSVESPSEGTGEGAQSQR